MHISLRSHAHLASTSSHYDQAIFPSLCLSMPAGHDFLSRWCDLTVGSGRGQRGKSASTPIPDQRLGRKTFPSFLSRFFGWIRNYTDVRQTNRRKTNLTVCVRKGVPWKGSWRGAGTLTPPGRVLWAPAPRPPRLLQGEGLHPGLRLFQGEGRLCLQQAPPTGIMHLG